MLAISLALILFCFMTLLGKAVMEVMSLRFPILRSWLLAPTVGLALIVLACINLNQVGLPVRSFALPLTLVLAGFIGVVFAWRRPIVPWKQLSLFLAIAFFSVLYGCWPMFLYGFRWVGYMNADMAGYCLGAVRAMNNGFYRVPTLAELTGTDYSQYYWFHYATGLFRCGADIFLAWFASVTHMAPLQITMPALGGVNAIQLFASGGLILARPAYRRVALLTVCLVAASPLFLLGIVTQLLPQVGGIALLLGLCILIMQRVTTDMGRTQLLKTAILSAIIGAAMCIYYPEVMPFAGLAVVAFHGYHLLRGKHTWNAVTTLVISSLLLVVWVARQGIVTAVGTVMFAVAAGINAGPVEPTSFDTMLDPSLFAALFGLQPYIGIRTDPWISIAILLGMVFLLLSLIVAVVWVLKSHPAAFLFLVMFALGAKLFFSQSAFGLFKLAMYVQPVLLFPLASVSARLFGRRCYISAVVYLAATGITAFGYIAQSTDLLPATALTMPGLERTDVRALSLSANQAVLVNPDAESAASLYAAANVGRVTKWADFDYFAGLSQGNVIPYTLLTIPGRIGITKDYLADAGSLSAHLKPDFESRDSILGHVVRKRDSSLARGQIAYVGHPAWDAWHSSNNTLAKQDGNYFVLERSEHVQDYLVLLTSDLGGPRAAAGQCSRWPAERDLFRPDGTFFGIGRRLLFEVVRPTPNARLRISVSRTLMGNGRTALPAAAAIDGSVRMPVPFIGAGAANVITPPLRLLYRDGHAYMAIDFGTDGTFFPNRKTGLLRLFHQEIPNDNRKLVGFARDIAVVGETEYASLQRPAAVSVFPADLLKPRDLEYSGIYEDGWVSDRAFVVLGRSEPGDLLQINADLPSLGSFVSGGNQCRVLLNGKAIYEGRLRPGPVAIQHAVAGNAALVNRVEFFFGAMQPLPAGDDRPVALRLLCVKIVHQPAGAVPLVSRKDKGAVTGK